MIEEVGIRANGQDWGGWDSVTIQRNSENPVQTFTFSTTKEPLMLSGPRPSQDVVQIFANRDLLLTGYIEKYNLSVTSDGGRMLEISGRSKAADLADCSAQGSFRDQSGEQIIRQLCAPFGIEADIGIELKRFSAFTPETGKSILGVIYDALQCVPEAKISSAEDGSIRIRNNVREKAGDIELGSGVLEIDIQIDRAKQFSEYTVLAQDAGFFNGVQASEIGATATDAAIRFRPVIVFSNPDYNDPKARDQAERVMRRQFGRANTVRATATGWRNSKGNFWSPDQEISVKLPMVSLTENMVISSVSFEQSLTSGTLTKLEMQPIASVQTNATPSEPDPQVEVNGSFEPGLFTNEFAR